jgi:hypothetical protein
MVDTSKDQMQGILKRCKTLRYCRSDPAANVVSGLAPGFGR